MTLYRIFIASFIISVIAFIAFMVTYLGNLMSFMHVVHNNEMRADPFLVFSRIFSPALIIAALILGLAALLYKVLGIVLIARNKKLQGGEQALWIIGFIMFGFVTAIVFMALSKSRNLIFEDQTNEYKAVQP